MVLLRLIVVQITKICMTYPIKPAFTKRICAIRKKGTGVAIYVHESLNATIDHQRSLISEHIGTIFVKDGISEMHYISIEVGN